MKRLGFLCIVCVTLLVGSCIALAAPQEMSDIKIYDFHGAGEGAVVPPFAEISMFTEDGYKEFYFALDRETINGFADDEKLLTGERMKTLGSIGISYTLGEKDEYGDYAFDYSAPESLVRMAEYLCDYETADTRVKTQRIRQASLRFVQQEKGELRYKLEQVVTEKKQLEQLQDLLRNSQYAGMGNCPYHGILTLTFEDGTTETMYKAIDDCDGIIAGSYTSVSLGEKGNKEFWAIFDKIWSAIKE